MILHFFYDICNRIRETIKEVEIFMKRIGVFCSACEQISFRYFECAKQLGAWMGQNSLELVYGGADLGLMDCVARSVKENGGTVIGVVPTKLEERGRVSHLLDVTFRTDNLSDRKDIIVRESDVLIALPGGIGTLDEVFHVVAAATIGYHHKQIILYNIDGFWDGLLAMLDKMEQQGFIRRSLNELVIAVSTWQELIELLQVGNK